ncbi:right-handed parallel beta-helix repeat-containing protein, partial [Spirochaetota bacterium]
MPGDYANLRAACAGAGSGDEIIYTNSVNEVDNAGANRIWVTKNLHIYSWTGVRPVITLNNDAGTEENIYVGYPDASGSTIEGITLNGAGNSDHGIAVRTNNITIRNVAVSNLEGTVNGSCILAHLSFYIQNLRIEACLLDGDQTADQGIFLLNNTTGKYDENYYIKNNIIIDTDLTTMKLDAGNGGLAAGFSNIYVYNNTFALSGRLHGYGGWQDGPTYMYTEELFNCIFYSNIDCGVDLEPAATNYIITNDYNTFYLNSNMYQAGPSLHGTGNNTNERDPKFIDIFNNDCRLDPTSSEITNGKPGFLSYDGMTAGRGACMVARHFSISTLPSTPCTNEPFDLIIEVYDGTSGSVQNFPLKNIYIGGWERSGLLCTDNLSWTNQEGKFFSNYSATASSTVTIENLVFPSAGTHEIIIQDAPYDLVASKLVTNIVVGTTPNVLRLTNMHVATNGTDSPGKGSEYDPFRTLQYAINSLNSNHFTNSDMYIYIHEGIYTNSANVNNASTTPTNRLVIRPWQSDTAIISNDTAASVLSISKDWISVSNITFLGQGKNDNALYINNAHNVTVDDIYTTHYSNTVVITGTSSNVTLKNSFLYTNIYYAIYLAGNSRSNLILSNTICSNSFRAVIVNGKGYNRICGNIISNSAQSSIMCGSGSSNFIEYNYTYSSNTTWNLHNYDGSHSNTIRFNTIIGHGDNMGLSIRNTVGHTLLSNTIKGFWAGIYFYYNAISNTVIGNTVCSNTNGIYMTVSSGNIPRYNTISFNRVFDNVDRGMVFSQCYDTKIYRNLIYGNSRGLSMYNSSTNNEIINNTIYNNSSNGIYFSSPASAYVYNNILLSNSSGTGSYAFNDYDGGSDLIDFDYNIVQGDASRLTNSDGGVVWGTHNQYLVDPKINIGGNFEPLNNTSPAVDAGSNWPGIAYNNDHPDAGWYESLYIYTNPGPFHVSPDGDDSFSGSISYPFRTLQKAIDLLGAQHFTNGHMYIYLHEGTYTNPANLTNSFTGSASNLVIAGWGNDQVSISNAGNAYSLRIKKNWSVISNITFSGGPENGLLLNGVSNVSLSRLTVYGHSNGICFTGASVSNDVKVCSVYSNDACGIMLEGNNCENNTFAFNNIHSQLTNINTSGGGNTFFSNYFGSIGLSIVSSSIIGTNSNVVIPYRLGTVGIMQNDVWPSDIPTNIAAATDISGIIISWDISGGSSGGYKIYRLTNNTWTNFTSYYASVSGGSITVYTDADPVVDVTNYYFITSYDSASPYPNESWWSVSASNIHGGVSLSNMHVATNGIDGSARGTEELPYRTLQFAFDSLTADHFTNGDFFIYLHEGTHTDGATLTNSVMPVNTNLIITSRTNENVIIDNDPATYALLISGSNIIISNITFSVDPAENKSRGIIISNSYNCLLADLSISGYSNGGILLKNACVNVTISNSLVFDNRISGIKISGDDCDRNTIISNSLWGHSTAIGNSRVIYVSSGDSNIIDGNTVFSNTAAGSSYAISFDNGASYNIIRNNYCFGGKRWGIYFDDEGGASLYDNIVSNNIIDGKYITEIGITLRNGTYNHLIENNRIINCWGYGFLVWENTVSNQIIANTVTNNTNAFWLTTGPWGNLIMSNRFVNNILRGLRINASHSNRIYRNVFSGLGRYGIWLDGCISNEVVNNTVYGCAEDGIHIMNNCPILVLNNIFLSNAQSGGYFTINDSAATAPVALDHNIITGDPTRLTNSTGNGGHGNYNIFHADPGITLSGDFEPTSTASYAVDAGTNFPGTSNGYQGKAVDIGWRESPYTATNFGHFHVATNGHDTWYGRQYDPFRTLQKAVDSLRPYHFTNGDMYIYLHEGKHTSNAIVSNSFASSGTNLVICSLTNTKALYEYFGALSIIEVQKDYTIISNIIFTNDDISPGDAVTIAAHDCSIIHVDSYYGYSLVQVMNGYTNVLIENCYAFDAAQAGMIFTGALDCKINSNIIYQCPNGIKVDGATNILITNNTIYSNWSRGINVINSSFSNRIIGNTIFSNAAEGVFIAANASDFHTIAFNYTWRNVSGGIKINNHSFNTIYRNRVIENLAHGIQIYTQAYNNYIINNTCVDNVLSGILVMTTSPGSGSQYIYNNILLSNDHYGFEYTSIGSTYSQYVDHNVIYGNSWGPTNDTNDIVYGANNYLTDPLLDMTTYEISVNTSDAVDNGTNYSSEITPSWYGTGPDIGWKESFFEAKTIGHLHVSTTGNDDYPGTEIAPLRTLQKAIDSLTADHFTNGDMFIYMHAGTHTSNANLTNSYASADTNLVITAWTNANAVIGNASGDYALYIKKGYTIISNIDFSYGNYDGIRITNTSEIMINDISVTFFTNHYGIVVEDRSSNVTISGSEIHSNNPNGIYCIGANISGVNILSNTMGNNRLYIKNGNNYTIKYNSVFTNEGIYYPWIQSISDSEISYNSFFSNKTGLVILYSTNISFCSNHVYNNEDNGVAIAFSVKCLVLSNTVHNNANVCGILIDNSYSNNVIQNRVFSNGPYGIKIWKSSSSYDNIVASNIVYNNIECGIYISNAINNTIRLNTVSNNANRGIAVDDGALSNTIELNNIFL